MTTTTIRQNMHNNIGIPSSKPLLMYIANRALKGDARLDSSSLPWEAAPAPKPSTNRVATQQHRKPTRRLLCTDNAPISEYYSIPPDALCTQMTGRDLKHWLTGMPVQSCFILCSIPQQLRCLIEDPGMGLPGTPNHSPRENKPRLTGVHGTPALCEFLNYPAGM